MIPLLPVISTCDQHSCIVDCKGHTDTVEFAGEDLEHDKCEGKLGQRRADIGTFEDALCSTGLDKLGIGYVDGSGADQAPAVFVLGVVALEQRLEVRSRVRNGGGICRREIQ